jgi:hypothetical protein
MAASVDLSLIEYLFTPTFSSNTTFSLATASPLTPTQPSSTPPTSMSHQANQGLAQILSSESQSTGEKKLYHSRRLLHSLIILRSVLKELPALCLSFYAMRYSLHVSITPFVMMGLSVFHTLDSIFSLLFNSLLLDHVQ